MLNVKEFQDCLLRLRFNIRKNKNIFYYKSLYSIFLSPKSHLLNYFLTIYICLGATPPSLLIASQAVVVESDCLDPGGALEPGTGLKNTGQAPAFILLATGRLERIEPGGSYRVPEFSNPRAWFFDSTAAALRDFHLRYSRLSDVLEKKFPDSEAPDTVENRLVYPVGAALIELPDAFKWQNREKSEVLFELWETDREKPLVQTRLSGDRLDRENFEHLLAPGPLYRWSVANGEQADTSYFSLLPESRLPALSQTLTVLDRLEMLDTDRGNTYGWLVIKAAALCRLGLFYEARAQVLARLNKEGTARRASTGLKNELYDLLRRVRRLQRYGYLL